MYFVIINVTETIFKNLTVDFLYENIYILITFFIKKSF
uniref:Uncharacterized protein n=1 Tax=Platysiphonia delicata TaxID=2006979 RepID=A0A1Z1M0J9_9FLOR|nr:hypothetical protein [Platysiphonia delicata]ARW59618.1 hypothetical protein [Platysiphonia delicata]